MTSYNPPNIRSNIIFNKSYNLTKSGVDSNQNTLTDKEKFDLLTMYKEFQVSKNSNSSSTRVIYKGNYPLMQNSIQVVNLELILYDKGFKFKPIDNNFKGTLVIKTFNTSTSVFTYKNNLFDKTTYYSLFSTSDSLVKVYIYDETYGKLYKITYMRGYAVKTGLNIVTGVSLYDDIVILENII